MKALLLASLLLQEAPTGFRSAWPEGITRSWVGPEFWANRLQDWRIHRGWLECLESSATRPMRVVHLLSRSAGEQAGKLELRVLCTPLRDGGGSFCGFLLGAGGSHVDYRLTALVHHRPAQDGGLVAALDGGGRLVFRDNEKNVAKGGWAITGKLREGELLEVPASSRQGTRVPGTLGAVELRLAARPRGQDYRLVLSVHVPESGGELARAVLDDVDPELVAGSLALVAHRGKARFRDFRASGGKLRSWPERSFGPVLAAQYSLSRGTLKLTAQMPPLGESDTQRAEFQLLDGGSWRTVAGSRLVVPGYTFPFRVEDFDATRAWKYRVAYRLRQSVGEKLTSFEGTIRKEPVGKRRFVLAAFTGNKHFTGGIRWNHDGVWFPHRELVRAVRYHDPDLLFFSGDQIYEGDLTGAQRRPPEAAMLDYLDKWYRWCWAFRDLARSRPCICIPDDHDVYHGNLWGAGGRFAKRQDDGGYRMPASFVKMVERTQVSHLPDPADPRPVAQGIGVYFTELDYAGLSFAILEDRKFKSSPSVMIPDGKVVNGWFQNPDFDPATQADVPGAVLLGQRQLAFLRAWAADWSHGTWMKVVLSQTLFANVATLPREARSDNVVPGLRVFEAGEYPENDRRVADADSNGWPQTGRNKALGELRRGFAFHIAGDQHLGSCIHYGVEDWDDAGFALCVPSIANTWPRRWFPPEPGLGHRSGEPRYTGRYLDGFGNRMRVLAVSNPLRSGRQPAALHDRAPGYGIVRFDRKTREILVECWPRGVDPGQPGARQYPGWPITVRQLDNYGRKRVAWLPELRVEGMQDPVVQVLAQQGGELVYALRIQGKRFKPFVFREGSYTLRIGEPGTERWRTLRNLRATKTPQEAIQVGF